MTTILKKSLNNPAVQVLRRPDGVILITPIRLVCVPDEALIAGVSVIGASLSYTPKKGAHAIQIELASHEEAQEVLTLMGQMLAESPPDWTPQARHLTPPDSVADTERAISQVSSTVSDRVLPDVAASSTARPWYARLMSWIRGKGCWRHRVVFMGLAAFSFWLFYPEDNASVAPLSFNLPASAIVGSPVAEAPGALALSPSSSPYANDPLAIGLNTEAPTSVSNENGALAGKMDDAPNAVPGLDSSVAVNAQGVDQPYVFKPNLVRPVVDVPALNCD